MLSLDSYPEFKSDIQGGTTNIHPVVKIETNPILYLSQNEESMPLTEGGTTVRFQALNLKIPSIKESLDIKNRNFKINNFTITLSNTYYTYSSGSRVLFSDLLATSNFINSYVQIYWKSQSCKSLNQCLPVYRGLVKRVTHDYDNVKIILEDLTESVMHKQVPIGVLDTVSAYREEDINKTIPMVYGKVQKAPCVLWKNIDLDSSTLKRIYTLVDRFDIPVREGEIDIHDQIREGMSGTTDFLYVYSGEYLKVMKTLDTTPQMDEAIDFEAPSNPIQQVEIEPSEDTPYDVKVYLRATYSSIIPTNLISQGRMQVLYNRKATNFDIADLSNLSFSDWNTDATINWAIPPNEDNVGQIDVSAPGNAIDDDWETYASVPTYNPVSYGAEIAETEDGWFPLTNFNNGAFNGNAETSDAFLINHNTNSTIWDEETPHITENEKYWHWHRNVNRFLGTDLADKVELIRLPNAKKLYTYFSTWYNQNYPNGRPLRAWGANVQPTHGMTPHISSFDKNFFNHQWGTPLDFQRNEYSNPTEAIDINDDKMWDMTDFHGAGSSNRTNPYDNFHVNLPSSQNLGDVNIPNYLYKLALDIEDLNDSASWYQTNINAFITFAKTPGNSSISGYHLDGLPNPSGDGAISIDFWDLMEYNGKYYDTHFPRYRIKGLNQRHETYMNLFNLFWDDLDVEWNGVDGNIWNNTSGNAGTNQVWDAAREITIGSGWELYGTFLQTGENSNTLGWNKFFNNNDWHVHFTSSYTFPGSGITAPKGLMIPAVMTKPTWLPGAGSFPTGIKVHGYHSPGGHQMIEPPDDGFFTIRTESHTLNTYAVMISLLGSNIDDEVEGSGFSYVYGKIQVEESPNHSITNLNNRLQLNQFGVDLPDTPDEGVELIFLNELTDISLTDLSNCFNGLHTMLDTSVAGTAPGFTDGNITSTDWDVPSRFNATMLGFSFEDLDTETQATFRLGVNNLGMKHIFEIENIFDKNYYLETGGRIHSNISEGTPPTSVIRHIIEEELGIGVEVDEQYNNINTSLSGGEWSMAFSQTEKIEAKKIIQEIAKSSNIIPLFKSNAKLSMAIIQNTYSSGDVNETIAVSDIISSSADRTKIEDVKTMVAVEHTKDYETDSYKKTSYVSAYDFYGNGDKGYSLGYKKSSFGLDSNNPGDSVLEFKSDYVRYDAGYTGEYFGSSTPEKLRDFLLAFNCNQHTIIKFKTGIKYSHLEVSDIIKFDGLINGIKLYGENYTGTVRRNGQYIYPYFMITSINKSIDSVNIECMQLHNLDRRDGVLEQASGDFFLSGSVTEENFNALEAHWLNPTQYISEGQIYNCDINGDKIVDEYDLAIVAEMLDIPFDLATGTNIPVYGCTDPLALNYNPDATVDDGNCTFPPTVYGCTDENALNYNPNATDDNGTCEYPYQGEYGAGLPVQNIDTYHLLPNMTQVGGDNLTLRDLNSWDISASWASIHTDVYTHPTDFTQSEFTDYFYFTVLIHHHDYATFHPSGDPGNLFRYDFCSDMSYFQNFPDIFNLGNEVATNNDVLINSTTPNGLANYSGTGEDVPLFGVKDQIHPYEHAIYIKIGEGDEAEWLAYSSQNTSLFIDGRVGSTTIGFKRGWFGTAIRGHAPGEPVKIYRWIE